MQRSAQGSAGRQHVGRAGVAVGAAVANRGYYYDDPYGYYGAPAYGYYDAPYGYYSAPSSSQPNGYEDLSDVAGK